jgi:hypothetical protein
MDIPNHVGYSNSGGPSDSETILFTTDYFCPFAMSSVQLSDLTRPGALCRVASDATATRRIARAPDGFDVKGLTQIPEMLAALQKSSKPMA